MYRVDRYKRTGPWIGQGPLGVRALRQLERCLDLQLPAGHASNAPDISGVSTTLQIGGAAFGGPYFALAGRPGDETDAHHTLAVTCIALAAAALTATFTAHLATHRRPPDRVRDGRTDA